MVFKEKGALLTDIRKNFVVLSNGGASGAAVMFDWNWYLFNFKASAVKQEYNRRKERVKLNTSEFFDVGGIGFCCSNLKKLYRKRRAVRIVFFREEYFLVRFSRNRTTNGETKKYIKAANASLKEKGMALSMPSADARNRSVGKFVEIIQLTADESPKI
jgi:hypothetical protein